MESMIGLPTKAHWPAPKTGRAASGSCISIFALQLKHLCKGLGLDPAEVPIAAVLCMPVCTHAAQLDSKIPFSGELQTINACNLNKQAV